jgi:hypothetical protein
VLRISTEETASGALLHVEGRLAGPWVEVLGQACRSARRPCLDLRGLRSADTSGRRLLRELKRAGTELRHLSGYLAALIAGND